MIRTLLLLVSVIVASISANENIVRTKLRLGNVLGKLEEYNGQKYSSFRGIRYAKAPIGKLRFREPEAFDEAWENDFDATGEFSIKCSQMSSFNPRGRQEGPVEGVEDCLFINVYTPKTTFENKDASLPVMVWIHGGGFISGDSGPTFYGPQYFMETQEVVLVTFNYRVGALGFLSLDDDVISGNMGLKDQNMALRWVQQNIESFGGNPNQVTLFGESAGGVSVAAHILSPWSSGLFHKAIVQSGGMVKAAFLFLSQNPSYYGSQLATELGVGTDASSDQILEILQSKPVEEIADRNNLFETYLFTGNPWMPIKDDFAKNPFLPGDFNTLFKEGKYNKVPIILGGTKDEGAMYIPQFLSNPDRLEDVNADFDLQGPILWLGIDEDDVTEQDSSTANIILREYFPGPDYNLTMDNIGYIKDIFTDALFLGPINIQAKLIKNTLDNNPLYYYNYRHKSALTLTKLIGVDPSLNLDLGVCHADELFAMFYQKDLEAMKSPADREMGQKLLKLWIQFAKTGEPDPEWKPVSKEENQPSYAILDTKPLRMANEKDFERRMTFIESMLELNEAYRHFNFLEHPAVVERLRVREEEPEDDDDHDEL